jgi:GT2 family glycosyltransferase
VSSESPSFDLVVATVGRGDELARFLDSVEMQEYSQLRVILVDQNTDDRVAAVTAGREFRIEILHSAPGLSRARNVGLAHVDADVVAFPDDDCVYAPGLLARVASRFASDAMLDGLSGRAADPDGRSAASWKSDGATLTSDNLWNRTISFTIFLRREVVERVGAFDEQLGLGSGEPWSSGEEIDYLIRAVRGGTRIEYDPSLVVVHDVRADDAEVGARDGASVGYLLRKHGYGPRVVTRMLVRPVGGILASLVGRDRERARYHLAALSGRIRGYRGAKRSNSSA